MLDGKEVYLGLDVSTKTIGICLMTDDGSENGSIIELTHISPKAQKGIKGTEELFIKTKMFEDFITQYIGFGVDKVIIEEPLLMSNNANTVASLLRFNGMVSHAIYRLFGLVPEYISSYDARKYSFPDLMAPRKYGKADTTYPREKILKEVNNGRLTLFGSYPWTIDKKAVIQGKVAELFPSIEWIYGKKGELKKQNFDATDAYVAARGYINKKRYGELELKVSDIVESDKFVAYKVNYWDRTEKRTTFLPEKQKEADD